MGSDVGIRTLFINNYFKKVINGSIIVFIATPRPAIATKNAVIFSIRALNFDVDG